MSWIDQATRAAIIILSLLTIGSMITVVYRFSYGHGRGTWRGELRPLAVVLLSSSWLLYTVAITIGMVASWGRSASWWWGLYALSLVLALAGLAVVARTMKAGS